MDHYNNKRRRERHLFTADVKNIIPNFIKDYRLKRYIQKRFGEGNKIQTTRIHPDARLGKSIYLARDVDIRADVEIQDHSYCSPGAILFPGTKVGKYCSIGYNVQIGLPEHPWQFFTTSPSIYKRSKAKQFCAWPADDFRSPVTIGNDVWIGSNAVILQGVTIGDGAVVAAASVVTRSIQAYTIYAGVPAKQLKMRFDQERVKLLQESEWWNHDLEWIEEFANKLYNENEDRSICSD